ncbi:DUF3300 domain-containing protein [Superficieibacter sp. HKU1]|uniref:DUF3300 domain-containing protein n=1 Tax=Superficieibacter sp. HKU1 TaxID=3031919 RepID=UPI0023E091B7|nr:DUF3300 domain-containing protein [Superficieibacter sp. HKU1]WES69324.1 DUF3300 domain-containing protein [Superficieibacter sp. HKU1]
MTLPFKPHVIALACSLGLFAASGVLYVKSRQPATTSETVATPAAAPAPAAPAATTFTPAQIDQWVAPIALYPDALLSQVLMASTYPASVVQAVQWSKDHPTLQGDAAIQAAANQPWDASVKSLVAFPQLMALMGQDPQWVENLGNAFLAQPQDVMDSVQKLRTLAQQTGTLKSTPQQKVTSEPTVASTADTSPGESRTTTVVHSAPSTIIKIEPADPQVVYVPTYNPTTVYGTWPNTAYPPVYLPPPPGQQFADSFVKGFGYSLGVATTYALFSSIDWDHDHHHHHHDDDDHHHHDDDHYHHDDHDYHGGGYIHNGDNININVNNYNRITGEHLTDNSRIWQHNPAHRNGVPYVNNAHPVNVSGGLSATAAPGGQRQAALSQLQGKTAQPSASVSRDAQRQAASKQLEQIAQRNNYRGYDTSNLSRGAARTQLASATPDQRQQLRENAQQRLNSSTQEQRQQAKENLQQRLNAATPEQRQQARENVQQRLNAATPEQRQQARANVQQRLNSATPEQRQRLRDNVQQRRANALSGNDSRSPSWQSQRQRGSESRRQENHFSSEQRSAIRERVAEHRRH